MADLPAFEVSYDYLCPFAHIAHEHVVEAVRAGAAIDVTFTPWTLRQVHRDEAAPDVWDDPAKRDDLLALESSLVVRDAMPDRFLDVHLALFRARHERGIRLSTRDEVAGVLAETGVDVDAVFEAVEHRAGDQGAGGVVAAARRRLRRLRRPDLLRRRRGGVRPAHAAPDQSRTTPSRRSTTSSRGSSSQTNLNEFKRTRIPR